MHKFRVDIYQILDIKKIAKLFACIVIGMSANSFGDSGSNDRASAQLRSLNDSGIQGHVTFVVEESELIVTGGAIGLDPDRVYISLLYDILSVATGAWACEPGFDAEDPFLGATQDAPGRLTLLEMGVDLSTGEAIPLLVWNGANNGYDVRYAVNGAVDVDLDRVRTISIRDTSIDDGVGPMAVVACGLVVPGN